jgi:hypothetical protein
VLVWIALGLVVLVFLGVYSAWTAGRLDRLHARLDAAAVALDGQLKLRTRAAGRFCESPSVPANAVAELAEAVAAAAEATGLGHDREAIENRLSRAVHAAAADSAVGGLVPGTSEGVALVDAMTRAGFARRFHNDAVRDALVLRRRWIVRLLHLAGHAPRPQYFEIDDAPLTISDVARTSSPYD